MSELIDLVQALRERSIRVWLEGGQLRYAAPPGSFSDELRERVRARREAMVAWLGRDARPSAEPRRVDRDGGALPTSLAQARMFFLDRLAPGAYHCPAVIPLDTDTDEQALRRALEALVARHEALRTSFRLHGSDIEQVVQPPSSLALPRLAAADAAEGQRLADAFFAQPFDLVRGTPLRGALLEAGHERVLLLCLHHIVTDGWSIGIMVAELRRLMAGETLPPPAWQYADFAAWQRSELEGRIQREQLPFWQGRLAGAPAALDLPTDRPRPSLFPIRAALLRRTLGAGLEPARVDAAARAAGVTPFMLMLAAFQALLHRCTGAEDLCVGTPVANRVRPEFAGTIGCFVNTVVLRAAPAPLLRFDEFVAQVRDTVVAAFDHQELPFEQLVEHLQLPRDPSRHPLFQALFVLQTNEGAEHASLAAAGGTIRAGVAACKFDLNVAVAAAGGRYHVECEYAADLYDEPTVEHLFRHYENLLRGAIEAPRTPIGLLPMLDHADHAWLARVGTGPHRALAAGDSVLARIERQAAATPDAPALRCGERLLSRAELAVEADGLAAQLRARGVGRGALCALLMERSVAMVRAILAAMKCGAAWLPIDPALPAARIAFILRDARAAVLMTQGQAEPAAASLPCPVLVCGEDAPPPAPPRAPTLSAEDWAYVLYTSGTTGQPKGVVNHHAGLLNRIDWMQRNFPIGPGDTVLQKTNYAFDVSVWEFLWPLATGAVLAMAAPSRHGDPRYLSEEIERSGVTVMHFVPSMLASFSAAAERERLASLRAVFASGEALPAHTVAAFRALAPQARLFNLYGPTEAAIDVTVWDCGEPAPHPDMVPLGRPIDNVEIHIVDALGQPAAPGVCGELCIGGIAPAAGYLGRPALTAAAFVPHPSRPGQRLYRTGDRARWRHEGVIEYFGRLDLQVKLRGLRLELGEVEAQLTAQEGIVNAGAVVVRAGGGEQHLVAYVETTRAEDAAALQTRLKRALRLTLPEYMVPQRIFALERLPLNANGKLDRKQLMQRPLDLAEAAAETVPAAGELERRVQAVWTEVLGAGAVGVTHNFFEAGGTSLLMIAVQQRLAESLGREVPIVKLFAHPTIRECARYLAEGDADGAPALAAAVQTRTEGVARLGRLRHRYRQPRAGA